MPTQALYRTWRPALFADVYGQDAVITTLRNQVASGRVSHAYLFCGSRGTGKTSAAKIFARAVNCENPQEGEPCGHCGACVALSAENSLDIVEIDAASNNGVDEIRDLRDKVKYPPQHGRYRVYIIDEVHMLSTGAFNALLKTLEEPPPHALFILATTEPQRLPATVLSRVQRYDFRRIPAEVIVRKLQVIVEGEHGDVTPDALLLIARYAEGGLRDAISLLDMALSYGGGSVDAALVREVLGAADRGTVFGFADQLIDGDAGAAIQTIDRQMRAGREPNVFARDITQHLRALLLAQTAGNALADLLETTDEDAAQLAAQAQRLSRERLLLLLDIFLASETDMKWASHPRTALEIATARACLPEDALRLDALAARLDLLERKIATGDIPAAQAAPAAVAPAAPPAVPKKRAAPAPTAPTTGDAIWEKARALIRKEPQLNAPLMQGKFGGFDGDTARIIFDKGGAVFANMLRQEARRERLEALLTEAAGRPITLAITMDEPQKANAPQAKDAMQQAFEMFGRENVQIVDADMEP